MLLNSKFFRVACSLLLTLSLSMLVFADTIRLKNGSILKGRIVSFADGKFTIAIGEGSRLKQFTYLASEIESILFDSPDKTTTVTAAATNGTRAPIITTSSVSTTPPKVVTTDNLPRSGPTSKPAAGTAKPIEWSVKVLADNTSNGWTNTGWVLKKGQRIRISGDGTISLGKGKTSTPSGVADLEDNQKLLKSVATGALLAVIGDDNNEFIYIGATREFTATRDGALFLGINEGFLDDNSGSFSVKVEILPGDGK